MKKPRTLGREKKENQEGRWLRAFLATLSSRKDPPHFEKRNKTWEVNIRASKFWNVIFKGLGERIRNLDLGEAFELT